MCKACGCERVGDVGIHSAAISKLPASTEPASTEPGTKTLTVHAAILDKNDRLAQVNRQRFQAKGLLVLNLLASPGAGKTALIERMVSDRPDWQTGVIVGDLETDNDARRLRQAGAAAVQITTGTACHLEASMVERAATQLELDQMRLLIIENVGNLVCPAAYDLGETLRVALLSVTEGEDKPLKYAPLFKTAQAVLITKMDIAEAVGVDLERAIANIRQVVPQAEIFTVSARSGQGMADWYGYIDRHLWRNR